MANSVDPDQTAPLWCGSTLFVRNLRIITGTSKEIEQEIQLTKLRIADGLLYLILYPVLTTLKANPFSIASVSSYRAQNTPLRSDPFL